MTTEPLRDHHKHCDDYFVDAEEAARQRRWPECQQAFTRFRTELEAHFTTEEQTLFPAFEEKTGMVSGPTQVMRMEHAQMRDLVGQLAQAAGAQDTKGFAGAAETLLVLMQQHNMKEENILYPMCDQALDGQNLPIAELLRRNAEGG
jgi:iron-sulfur cluster repair protein YtfE (RIC family)